MIPHCHVFGPTKLETVCQSCCGCIAAIKINKMVSGKKQNHLISFYWITQKLKGHGDRIFGFKLVLHWPGEMHSLTK